MAADGERLRLRLCRECRGPAAPRPLPLEGADMPDALQGTPASMKCCQQDCTDEATHKVFWPGREILVMCQLDKIKAQALAAAMGCFIYTEELTLAEINREDYQV